MIGSNYFPEDASFKTKLLARLVGIGDIHTQYRLKPVFSFLKSEHLNHEISATELGCGPGLNLIEFARIAPQLKATGYDLDEESIAKANAVASRIGLKNISFVNRNAILVTQENTPSVDYFLLIDFLEHVEKPADILRFAARNLSKKGKIIISVPTPQFPNIVGRQMHAELGHLVDGYTIENLDEIAGPDLVRITHIYSTGPIASVACKISYQYLRHWGPLGRALNRIFTSLRPPDWFCHNNNSISLFAVYQHRNNRAT